MTSAPLGWQFGKQEKRSRPVFDVYSVQPLILPWYDFEAIKIKEEKNRINGLTKDYYEQIIVNGSMVHFGRVEEFLKNPRNRKFASLYHDAADELKQSILVHRKQFETFDNVFAFLSSEVQQKRTALKYERRLANFLFRTSKPVTSGR